MRAALLWQAESSPRWVGWRRRAGVRNERTRRRRLRQTTAQRKIAMAADTLVLGALDELDCGATAATLSSVRTRSLSRALEAAAASREAHGISRWSTFVSVMRATQPLEDDLLRSQRALRRAHASLEASLAPSTQDGAGTGDGAARSKRGPHTT